MKRTSILVGFLKYLSKLFLRQSFFENKQDKDAPVKLLFDINKLVKLRTIIFISLSDTSEFLKSAVL